MELDGLRDAPLGRLVHLAGKVAYRRWGTFLADRYGLTGAGMSVLLTLHHHGELTHREMADRCFIRPASLTGVVDTLEKAGYVRRQRANGDRRTVRLALTGLGTDRIQEIIGVARTRRPLTSVDADPAKAAVIREFLLELIEKLSDETLPDGKSDGEEVW